MPFIKAQESIQKPKPVGWAGLFPSKTHQPRLTLSQPKPMRFEEAVFGEDTVRLAIIDGARQEKQADPAAPPMQHRLPQQ
jgi:hypothetical protein